MDLSNIKLVVSDMDGTLLNNEGHVSNKFFSLFEDLKRRKIHFVAASGRQYQSILDKLTPIKDEISIIAENGGLVQHNNMVQVLFKLSYDDVLKTIKILRNIDNCYIVLCGRKSAYIETKDSVFVSKFSKYYSVYTIVEDLTRMVDDEFLKIAVYHFDSSECHVLPFLEEITKELKVVVSGRNWLDISHPEVDKSFALSMLQSQLKISEDETMVFGDYNNDIEMLQLGYFSYAMKNAHPDVRKVARFKTTSNSDGGVEKVIEQLLNNNK